MRKPLSTSAKSLAANKLAELRKNAFLILDQHRRNILVRSPFFGQVMMQLDIVPVRDPRVSTAATDGKTIYFDIDFLSQLSDNDREFILEHELVHNILAHSIRLENRDRELFNIAADMEVNDLLRCDGLSVPKTAIMPKLYGFENGLSAEEYYDKLLAQQKNRPSRGDDDNGSSGGAGGSSSFNQKLDGQFDKHIYNGDKAEDEEPAECEDRYGKIDDDAEYQPQPSRSNANRMKEAAVSAAQQISRECGDMPDHLKRLISQLVKPTVEWRNELAKFITRTTGEVNRSWARPNRRFASSGLYLPSSSGDKLRVAVGLDTSGSTVCSLKRFVSEVAGIMGAAGEYELHIIQCDVRVKKADSFSSIDNPFDPELEYETSGGGGTNLCPIFEHIRKNQLDVDAIIMFTDGEFGKLTDNDLPDVPVLWAVTTDGTTENLPNGSLIVRVKPEA